VHFIRVRFCFCKTAPQQVPAHLLLPQSHAQLRGETVQKEALGILAITGAAE
jgi:hypothetical protein